MARTNAQKVKNLVPTKSGYVSVAINSANQLVTERLSDYDMSDNTLTEIETYLAAHFLVQNPKIRKETGAEFMEYKEGFKNTNFGQQAIELDNSNVLASLHSSQGYEFKVL